MSLMYGADEEGCEYLVHYEYEGFYPGSPCHQIMQADPQGGEYEPTQADMDRHRQWAIDTFGIDTWRSYSGEEPELPDREPGQ